MTLFDSLLKLGVTHEVAAMTEQAYDKAWLAGGGNSSLADRLIIEIFAAEKMMPVEFRLLERDLPGFIKSPKTLENILERRWVKIEELVEALNV